MGKGSGAGGGGFFVASMTTGAERLSADWFSPNSVAAVSTTARSATERGTKRDLKVRVTMKVIFKST
jgi:hypothetical protein